MKKGKIGKIGVLSLLLAMLSAPSSFAAVPAFDSSDSFTTQENVLTTVVVADVDASIGVTNYAILSSTVDAASLDAGDLTIDADDGEIRFAVTPDFEAPADSNADNTYVVRVRATNGDGTSTQTVYIDVTDSNPLPPADATLTAIVQNTNATVVSPVFTMEDAGGNYILGGADAGDFTIDAATGVVTWAASPDFETPTDATPDNVYEFTVTYTDVDGTSDTVLYDIAVTDAVYAPSDDATLETPENSNPGSAVTGFGVFTDIGTGTYTLGGADAASFTIDPATGVVTWNATRNFEDPSSVANTNAYSISVTYTENVTGATDTVLYTINITNVDESPTGLTVTPAMGGYQLAWTPNPDANMGTIQFYTYEVEIDGNWHSSLSLGNRATIGGLSGTTSYDVRVAAVVNGIVQDYATGNAVTLALPVVSASTGNASRQKARFS